MTLASARSARLSDEGAGCYGSEVREPMRVGAWEALRRELMAQGFRPCRRPADAEESLSCGALDAEHGSEQVTRYDGGVVIYSRVQRGAPGSAGRAA